MSQEEDASAARDPLTLGDVLRAARGGHPLLDAAAQRVRAAEQTEQAARGGFDPLLRARGQYIPLGGYPNARLDVEVRQPTPLWGLTVYGGWRLGLGSFAPYDYRAKTASGGELRAGAVLPLYNGGPIDRRRADIRIAAIGRDAAEADAEARAIEVERAAARAYWSWVHAGLRRDVHLRLLDLAERRDDALARQIAAGSVAAVEGLDNRRAVLDRRAGVVAADRALEKAALELARHLRDGRGQILVLGPERLPTGFPEPRPPLHDLEDMVEEAWSARPDLARAARQLDVAGVEQRLARNRRSPRVDLDAFVARDMGRVDPVDRVLLPTEFGVGVSVEVPIPLRQARAELRRADAERARIAAELRFLRDTVTTEVRDAHSALVAAYERVALAREQVEVGRALADAEWARFQGGDSTLLFVNLREQGAAEAELSALGALADYHLAAVDLRAATGRRLGEEG